MKLRADQRIVSLSTRAFFFCPTIPHITPSSLSLQHDHKRRIEQTRAARLVKLAKKAKQIAKMNEFRVQAGLPPHQPRPKKRAAAVVDK
jgi:hypothetical protein